MPSSTLASTAPPTSTTAERRTLSPRIAFALVAAIIGLALFASSTPSPLYATYRELWGFSPVVLTLVYATYAFGVLASLLLAGRISDDVGRRPVLLIALTTLMAATILFMVADSVIWLFVARGIQGLATGLALGAASAALIDLHPRRDPAGVGLTNGVVSAGGLGLGVLVSAAIVEVLPAPRVLPYVALFVLFAIALAGAVWMPEPIAERSRPRLRPQRPSVPAVARAPFALAAVAVISSWSVGGLFMSLGPQLSATLFHTTDHLVAGAGVFALGASAAVAQILFGRVTPWLGSTLSSIALAVGLLVIVLASATNSSALFLTGVIVGGAGFGVAFLSALRHLSAAIPPAHRAEVMSAFYVVAYASLSLPAIAAGVAVTPLGLEPTFELFGSIVAGLALVAAGMAWRTRPQRKAVSARPALDAAGA